MAFSNIIAHDLKLTHTTEEIKPFEYLEWAHPWAEQLITQLHTHVKLTVIM